MIKIFNTFYPNITIKLKHQIEEAFVFGSMDDLEEVVGNIIENACKYGRKIIVEIHKYK